MTVSVSFIYRDAENRRYTENIYIAGGSTLAQADAVATAYSQAYSLIGGCTIIGANATFPLSVFIDPDPAAAGYTNERGATLSFFNSADRAESVYVPGLSLLRIGNGIVDAGNPDVQAFISGVTTGWGAGNVRQTDGNGLNLVAYRIGRQTTRKVKI